MENYEWVKKVPASKLSNRSLVLVSRFARVLKQVNGRVLALRDPHLPSLLVAEAQMSGDPRLVSLLNNLLEEFLFIAESEGVPVGAEELPESVRSERERANKKLMYRGVNVN